jgi:uncharacterized protein
MTHIEPELINSSLSQTVIRDGKPVKLEIYDDAHGGWLLEAVDQYGNSTVWDESFATEQAALDEALRAIDEEGIDLLIGPPNADGKAPAYAARIGDDFSLLADFLDNASAVGPAMDMQTLEGFLTAAVIGPRLLLPSEWLPWVWDRMNGTADAPFDGPEQTDKLLTQLIEKYNRVVDAFEADAFIPSFGHDVRDGAQRWCQGFLIAADLDGPAWRMLLLAHPGSFAPFLRLGTQDGVDMTERDGDARIWIDAIVPSLMDIRDHWRLHGADTGQFMGTTLVRAAPKVGRNDPCPCDSGKKYKRCCGAGTAPPTQP